MRWEPWRVLSRGRTWSDLGFHRIPLAASGEWTVEAGMEAGKIEQRRLEWLAGWGISNLVAFELLKHLPCAQPSLCVWARTEAIWPGLKSQRCHLVSVLSR